MIRLLVPLILLVLAACASPPTYHEAKGQGVGTDEVVVSPPQPGTPASADPTQQHEPRDLGSTAALHIYYYAPKSLEITHVETLLYADVEKCEDNIGKALMIFAPYASEGDLVTGKCIALHPPAAPKAEPPRGESTL